jgi:Zn-dependent M28 family amino/carboxypeptidase
MRLISVVLGADVEKKRFAATQALLNYGFSFYETHKLYDADEALTEARIYKGEVNELPLGLSKSLYVTIPKGRYKEMHASLRVNTSIEAPASVGAPYGSVTVTLGDDKVVIIHETTSAGYPWFVVQNGWTGAKLQLQSEDGNPTLPAIQGWFTLDAAKILFETSGLDLGKEIRRARTNEFTPVSMGLAMSTGLKNSFKEDVSQNVIAKIEGSKRPDEVIIYTAHWDHLGVGTPVEGDSINNGAVDNGTGLACVLSIAKAMAAQPEKPERTVVFLLVTAEEQGLLGSEWYSQHPIYPVDKTVANLNMDGLQSIGETNDLVVVGYGQSEMDEYATTAAAAQGRHVVPDQSPEKGYFFRSDHFNFARVGIPALYAESGNDHKEKGVEYGKKMRDEYTANNYHKPSDEYNENWDLSGLVQDTELFLSIGRKLASENHFPKWKDGSEFKSLRE